MPRVARPATAQPVPVIAPVRGLNTVAPGSEIPEDQCPFAYNVIGAENGFRSRLGYQEWVTGLLGNTDNTVRSIMPYKGGLKSGANDRLFCATQAGVYDVSASTQVPGAKKITFGTQVGDAGYGTYFQMTTPAARFAFFCDEENGLSRYAEVGDLWTANPGDITGVAAANLVAGTVFKNRAWFVQKESTLAWYLPLNSIAGAATSFDFGTKFPHGGILVGLYNWSYDGGSGIDNMLVGVSSSGDIVIYVGTDPALVGAFMIRGVWYTAGVPYGRRVATDFGGDTLVLTSTGILPLSKLVIGNPIVSRSIYETRDISNFFVQLVEAYGGLKGWSLRFHPNDGALIVTVPTQDGQATNQLAMSLATHGWTKYRSLPMLCAEAWNGKLYFGTHDGRICISQGYVDGVSLASGLTAYTPVDYSFITRSMNQGTALKKIVRQIRLSMLSGNPQPSVNAEARYGYSQVEASVPSAISIAAAGTWDNARWDTDKWAGDLVASEQIFGASGRGSVFALAVRGSAVSRTIVTEMQTMVDVGGFT